MNEAQLKTALFTIGIFGLGAVAVILYQHSLHTGQIIGALQGAQAPGIAGAPQSAVPLTAAPASLAGSPTIGQQNLVQRQLTPTVLKTGPYWDFGTPQGNG